MTENLPPTLPESTGKKAAPAFINAEQADEQTLKELLKGDIPIKFDWANKWLKGDEYSHILTHMDAYCKSFGFAKYTPKVHPDCIYIQPQNGQLYFVRGNTIGSDFGFPRLGIKKRFKWKKMNFTTDLPKKDPIVSYIVASAIKCEKFFPGSAKEGPVFRMHAVILTKRPGAKGQGESQPKKAGQPCTTGSVGVSQGKQTNSCKWAPAQNASNYILCHVRKVTFKKSSSTSDCESANEGIIDDQETKEEEAVQQFQPKNKQSEDNIQGDNLSSFPAGFKQRNGTNQRKLTEQTGTHGSQKEQIQTSKERRRRALTECIELNLQNSNSEVSIQESSDASQDAPDNDSDYVIRGLQAKQRRRDLKEARKAKALRAPTVQTPSHQQLSPLIQNETPDFARKLSYQPLHQDQELEKDAQLFQNLVSLNKRQKRSDSEDLTRGQTFLKDQSLFCAKNLFQQIQTSRAQQGVERIPSAVDLINNLSKQLQHISSKDKTSSAFRPVERRCEPRPAPALNPFLMGSPYAAGLRPFSEQFSEALENLQSKKNQGMHISPLPSTRVPEQLAHLQNYIESRQSTAGNTSAHKSSIGSPPLNNLAHNHEIPHSAPNNNYVNIFNALFNFCVPDQNQLMQLKLHQLQQQTLQQQQQQTGGNNLQFQQFR